MIAVIFELEPKTAEQDDYFALAAALKPIVENIDGFISIERYQSLVNPQKYLSLSFWRDEAAVQAWRNVFEHREAQRQGRTRIFQNYRLRVASVLRDYGMDEREQVPPDSLELHDGG
jgi:heme-degrading monooxygenase HmoA